MQINPVDVKSFELEVKLRDGGKQEYDYHKKRDHVSARVKKWDMSGKKTEQKDEAGIKTVENVLAELSPSPDMSKDELLVRSRSALALEESAIEHLEVEIEFADGREIEAETRH